jgi:hypothetical protein
MTQRYTHLAGTHLGSVVTKAFELAATTAPVLRPDGALQAWFFSGNIKNLRE